MSEFIGVVTAIGEQKLAASIGGAALALTTIRVGDGAGAAITPNAAMTDLVRRVGAAYPIVSSGRDATNPACWRVAATIPIEDGPFDIREIGVFDGDGDMIAIAKHVLVEKRAPAQGAAIELTSEMVFPVSGSAQIDIHVCAAAGVSIQRELRAPFLVVDASAVAAPPANPALGATYLAPAGATGAWAGLDGRLAQWDGVAWVAADAARGHVVADAARAKGDPARFLRREAEGWEAWAASLDDYGLARLASRADLIAALGGPVVDAALLAGMLGVDANGDAAYMATCSIFETPGTYSWVAPAWARRALIHGVGAGAGGGGWNAPYPGGGGSGGNKATAMVRVTPGVSYIVWRICATILN